MIAWPALERAAQQAGWKRNGRTWRGAPCPSCGGGTRDTAWVGPGTTAAFVAGCNAGCNGLEIARALVPDSDPSPVVRREPRTRAARAPAATSQGQPSPELPAAVWRAAAALRAQPVWRAAAALRAQPGATYLTARGLPGPWPVSVRWLPAESARRVCVRLPRGAAGCVVYLFAGPGEADTCAAQLEAVDTDGVRVKFYPWRPEKDRAKRPSVSGCTFDGGRRVFRARGDPDLAIHVCEGPLDALALVHLERLDLVELHGGAVHGTSGAALFRPAACPGHGPVTVWAQNDPEHQGQHAAVKLRRALRRAGRDVTIRLPPHGFKDWAEWVHAVGEDRAEREAIQHE